MNFTQFIPKPIKKVLKPIYYSLFPPPNKGQTSKIPKTLDEIHSYWKHPDKNNRAKGYLSAPERSQYLMGLMNKFVSKEAKILEIGCNVGRNLNYLYKAGFKNVSGIEINADAVEILKESYPEMAAHATIYNAPVEEAIKKLKDSEFDVIFTMAVLVHIHPKSEWIFKEMTRSTKNMIITIEDESWISWRHFPRNYKKLFTSLGMKQIFKEVCFDVSGLGWTYKTRIFKK